MMNRLIWGVMLASAAWGFSQSHQVGAKQMEVVPDSYLRAYDPITVFFPKATGPEVGGPLDDPTGTVSLEPSHPGEWRWLNNRTLQFSPTIAWPALERFRLDVKSKTFELVTFMAPPTRLEPRAGRVDLDPIRDLTLEFAHPIDTERLAQMVTVHVRDMPGLDRAVSGQVLTHRDFDIKRMERSSLQDRATYVLRFHREIGFGKTVELQLKLSLNEKDQRSLATFSFTTRPVFRLVAVGTSSIRYPISTNGSVYSEQQLIKAGSGQAPLFLEFSSPLDEIRVSDVKQMVQFEPAVRELSVSTRGNRVILDFSCDRERLYRMTLMACDIEDTFGRQLEPFGRSTVFFAYQSQTPYLRWRQAAGVMERFGPQELPLEGRGFDAVDLRIYKVDPLDHNFWPFPSRGLSIDEEQRPPGPGEQPEYGKDLAGQIRSLGSPLISRVVATPLKPSLKSHNFGIDVAPLLADVSGKRQAGTYLVGYRLLGTDSKRHYCRIQVTDLNVTSVEEEDAVVLFITSLRSAEPIQGASVIIEGEHLKDRTRRILFRGQTDVDGMVRFDHSERQKLAVNRVVLQKEGDTLVIDPALPPPSFEDNHWFASGSRFLSWLNNDPNTYKKESEWRAFIAPERPMYRPEDVVHIKGYLRILQGGRLLPAPPENLELVIRGPGSQEWTYPVEISSYGSFYHKFDVQDPPTGTYEVVLHDKKDDRWLGWSSFAKEAYRIPRFEVMLDGPEKAPIDRAFSVNLTAEFYAGGRVADHEVRWQVTPFPYRFQPKSYPGFIFSSDERFRGSVPPISRETQQSFDRTDENGSSSITIDPTQEVNSAPRRYVIEATVQGADEQTVTNTQRVLALPPFALGLKLDRVIKGSTKLSAQAVVLGYDGEPLPGHTTRWRVLRREWHSHLIETDFTTGPAKYQTDVVDNLVVERECDSTAKPIDASFEFDESGVYVVEVSARDQLGRLQQVTADVLILGETPLTWDKRKELVFDVVWDKSKYDPGETAKLVLKSPFQRGRALVVVEGKAQNKYHWVSIKNGQGVIELAATADMAPRIPVYVLAMRGRLDRSSDAPDAFFKPKTVGSETWLRVNPKAMQMQVALGHPVRNLPGSSMKLSIDLSDPDGNPLNGEVTLWLVDRAVLALAKEMDLDAVKTFTRDGQRWIRVRDSRNDVIGDLALEELPGGDGAPKSEESLFDQVTVRKNFKTVPYYNPAIQVVDGHAEVVIDLPDNLTEFAVRALATDGASRFGHAKSRLSIRLPVIIQTALPRFVRPGDQFVAGGIGRVVEGDGGPGLVQFEVTGLEANEPLSRSLTWEFNRPQPLYLPMKVTQPAGRPGEADQNVTVRMAIERTSDSSRDAFQVNLPVKPDREWVFDESIEHLKDDQALTLLTTEEPVRQGSLRRSLMTAIDPAVVRMMVGMDYLRRYPHGCAEQRVSRLYPEVVLKDWLELVGDQRLGDLKRWMEDSLRFLEEAQNEEGLFGYWPGSTGYVGLTAYVVEFLLEAQAAGYLVPSHVLSRATQALERSLRSDSPYIIQRHAYAERSHALAALAEAGKLDRAYAFELGARAQQLDLASEARILKTLVDHDFEHELVDSLKQDLERSIRVNLKDGAPVFAGMQYRSPSWGGAIHSSEVRSMALVMRSLNAVDRQHPSVPILKKALLERGAGDGWGSTQANAAAILALRDLMDVDLNQGGELELAFTDGSREEVALRSGLMQTIQTHQRGGEIHLRDRAEEVLVWQRLQYLPAEPGSRATRVADGFAVDRSWLVYVDEESPLMRTPVEQGSQLELHVGDVVEEHLRVVNPEDRYYVAITVPFAAGMDPFNPALATAPPEAKTRGQLTLAPSYVSFSDDRISYYYDQLPKGTYDFYVRLKASYAGTYTQPSAWAELMYRQAVKGRSPGAGILIEARD